jgi:hypothetical protein
MGNRVRRILSDKRREDCERLEIWLARGIIKAVSLGELRTVVESQMLLVLKRQSGKTVEETGPTDKTRIFINPTTLKTQFYRIRILISIFIPRMSSGRTVQGDFPRL